MITSTYISRGVECTAEIGCAPLSPNFPEAQVIVTDGRVYGTAPYVRQGRLVRDSEDKDTPPVPYTNDWAWG